MWPAARFKSPQWHPGNKPEDVNNMDNKESELCFNCRTYKKIDNFTNTAGGHVCDQCFAEYDRLCHEKNISFIEVPGRRATSMGGDRYTITDVFGMINGEKYHLSGYQPDGRDSNYPDQKKAQMFSRKMMFLQSDGEHIKFYSCGPETTPIKFITKIRLMNDNFGSNYDCKIKKYDNFWELHGNLERVSCAFTFRIFSKQYIDEMIDVLSDPYYKNINIEV